jgi:hypothetical protein
VDAQELKIYDLFYGGGGTSKGGRRLADALGHVMRVRSTRRSVAPPRRRSLSNNPPLSSLVVDDDNRRRPPPPPALSGV